MAKSSNRPLLWGLAVFLLALVAVVMTALYLDLRQKYGQLKAENIRLEQSQVLLMVPKDQAQALASWLENHPQQTEQLLGRAMKGQGTPPNNSLSLSVSDPAAGLTAEPQSEAYPDSLVPVVVSESDNGVKVIALPHGGIRVTTRDEKN